MNKIQKTKTELMHNHRMHIDELASQVPAKSELSLEYLKSVKEKVQKTEMQNEVFSDYKLS